MLRKFYIMEKFLLANLSFLLLVMSAVIFIELLLNFKKPLQLKLILLSIAFACLWKGFGIMYAFNYGYNRWLMELPNAILAGSFILLITHLIDASLSLFYRAYAFIIFITLLSLSIYYGFVLKVPLDVPITHISYYIQFIWCFFSVVTILLCLFLIFRLKSSEQKTNQYMSQLNNWAIYITSVFLTSCMAFLCIELFPSSALLKIINIIMDNLLVFMILFRPKFINNNHFKSSNTTFKVKLHADIDESAFTLHFFYHKYYVNPDANLESFAELLQSNPDDLRTYLKSHFKSSFKELINRNRIIVFQELVVAGKSKSYNLDGLAVQCGFSSRFHLFANFKKYHGGSPSDYIKAFEG